MPGGDRISSLKYGTKRCPKCGGDLVVREGRNGKFWGCRRYPYCNGTLPYNPVSNIRIYGIKICPKCGNSMHVRDGKYGKYWACENYPYCKCTMDYKENDDHQPVTEDTNYVYERAIYTRDTSSITTTKFELPHDEQILLEVLTYLMKDQKLEENEIIKTILCGTRFGKAELEALYSHRVNLERDYIKNPNTKLSGYHYQIIKAAEQISDEAKIEISKHREYALQIHNEALKKYKSERIIYPVIGVIFDIILWFGCTIRFGEVPFHLGIIICYVLMVLIWACIPKHLFKDRDKIWMKYCEDDGDRIFKKD